MRRAVIVAWGLLALGGAVTIHSAPGEGTTVRGEVPAPFAGSA